MYIDLKPSRCFIELQDGSERVVDRWDRAMDEVSELADIRSISCYVETPGATDLMRWEAAASWARPLLHPLPNIFFGITHDEEKLAVEIWGYLAKLIAGICLVTYGVGYRRDPLLGPEAYALGMVVQRGKLGPSELEYGRIGLWQREFARPRAGEPERFRHLSGLIRDVYPVSILSQSHLSKFIGGLRFAEWIGSASGRGTLTKLGIGNWLWSVSDVDIPLVREVLCAAQLVIADERLSASRQIRQEAG